MKVEGDSEYGISITIDLDYDKKCPNVKKIEHKKGDSQGMVNELRKGKIQREIKKEQKLTDKKSS